MFHFLVQTKLSFLWTIVLSESTQSGRRQRRGRRRIRRVSLTTTTPAEAQRCARARTSAVKITMVPGVYGRGSCLVEPCNRHTEAVSRTVRFGSLSDQATPVRSHALTPPHHPTGEEFVSVGVLACANVFVANGNAVTAP